jgi:hypothetical protein
LQASLSSAAAKLWPFSARGWVLLDRIVVGCEKISRLEGDESASYVALDVAIADILSAIYMCFVPKR